MIFKDVEIILTSFEMLSFDFGVGLDAIPRY